MHGRVDVSEIPLIRRQLSVGMHVPLSGKQVELFLRKLRVHHGKRNTVERRIPCGKERILPGVGHGQDIIQVHMLPMRVSDVLAIRRWWRHIGVTIGPLIPDKVVMLLAP